MTEQNEGSAMAHAQACVERLEALREHLREDIGKVDEPRMQAMFETAAEVLGGLAKAFRDYQEGQEQAFRRG